MKVFVFDTETTGFINKKETNLDLQPRIVQFAWILWEIDEAGNYKEIERVNILINPKISIPYAASQVHHIYDVDVKNAPFFENVVDSILTHINTPDLIIGHNIEYDEDMMKLELKRLSKEYAYKPKQTLCTMKNTVDVCKLEWNGNRFKYPKLWELHKHLFGEYFTGAHDAIVDVEATVKCFVDLVKKWEFKIKEAKETVQSLF